MMDGSVVGYVVEALALTWPCAEYYRHLGSESADGKDLSTSFSPCTHIKQME